MKEFRILLTYDMFSENGRYDQKIKDALAVNGQDIPDGGDGTGSSGGSGSGGTNSTNPAGNGGGSGTDGAAGVECLHVQTDQQDAFAIWRRSDGGVDTK